MAFADRDRRQIDPVGHIADGITFGAVVREYSSTAMPRFSQCRRRLLSVQLGNVRYAAGGKHPFVGGNCDALESATEYACRLFDRRDGTAGDHPDAVLLMSAQVLAHVVVNNRAKCFSPR